MYNTKFSPGIIEWPLQRKRAGVNIISAKIMFIQKCYMIPLRDKQVSITKGVHASTWILLWDLIVLNLKKTNLLELTWEHERSSFMMKSSKISFALVNLSSTVCSFIYSLIYKNICVTGFKTHGLTDCKTEQIQIIHYIGPIRENCHWVFIRMHCWITWLCFQWVQLSGIRQNK